MVEIDKLKIGLDIDGVLCCFISGAIRRANEIGLGEFFPKTCRDVTYWNTSERFSDAMKGMWEDHEFWLNLPSLSTEVPFIPDCYITSRMIPSEITEQWLEKNGYPKAPVITVKQPSEKLSHIKARNLDVFVDDLYTTVQELRDAGVNSILFKAPYQVGHVEECKNLPTIETLGEIYKYVGDNCEVATR